MTGPQKLWARPAVRGRPPGRPSRLDEIDPVAKSGSRGTRADQGVRPPIFAEYSQLEKRVALGFSLRPLSIGLSLRWHDHLFVQGAGACISTRPSSWLMRHRIDNVVHS